MNLVVLNVNIEPWIGTVSIANQNQDCDVSLEKPRCYSNQQKLEGGRAVSKAQCEHPITRGAFALIFLMMVKIETGVQVLNWNASFLLLCGWILLIVQILSTMKIAVKQIPLNVRGLQR